MMLHSALRTLKIWHPWSDHSPVSVLYCNSSSKLDATTAYINRDIFFATGTTWSHSPLWPTPLPTNIVTPRRLCTSLPAPTYIYAHCLFCMLFLSVISTAYHLLSGSRAARLLVNWLIDWLIDWWRFIILRTMFTPSRASEGSPGIWGRHEIYHRLVAGGNRSPHPR